MGQFGGKKGEVKIMQLYFQKMFGSLQSRINKCMLTCLWAHTNTHLHTHKDTHAGTLHTHTYIQKKEFTHLVFLVA